MPIRLICLDADDTLWHHERYYRATGADIAGLLAEVADQPTIAQRLAAIETRNLPLYGYGVKGFVLSAIETAIDIGGAGLPAATVRAILELGRSMMTHPIELIDGVADAVAALRERAPLVLVTKGDLFHQEAKLTSSGLTPCFSGVEIVSDKTAGHYRRIFARYGVPATEAVMAGNSVRSDVLPALEAGAAAALIPYPLAWDHEGGIVPVDHPRFATLTHLRDLAAWVDTLA